MEPLFRSRYQTPLTPSFRRAPVNMRPIPTRTPSPPQPQPQPRRVISIPVHYVLSETKTHNSAVKIQKIFRGFWVRKTVKKILELKRQVDAVEKKLLEKETMALIKTDGLERLRINETLMALLLKLDSVRGFNGGVRELRKAVIKKAIMLQESIDSATDEDDDGTMEEEDTEKIANESGENLENSGVIDEIADNSKEILDDSSNMNSEKLEKITEEGETAIMSEVIADETLEKSEANAENANDETENSDDSSKMQVETSLKISDEITDKTLEKAEIDANTMQVECLSGTVDSWECLEDETEEQKSEMVEAGKEDNNGGSQNCENRINSAAKGLLNEDWFVIGGGTGGDKGQETEKKEKLLEKVAEDSQRLMSMVADLCQKNALQTRMICSLSQRVEQLEKAMGDRLRKKKKKCNASSIY